MQKQKIFKHIFVLSLASFIVACSESTPHIAEMSQKAVDNLGCESLKSTTFDSLYKISEFQKEWPTSKELLGLMKQKWQKDSRNKKVSKEKVEEFFKEYSAILDSVKKRLPDNWNQLSREERLGLLAAIEMEDESTEEKQVRVKNFQSSWQKVEVSQASMQSLCTAPPANIGDLKNLNQPEVYGARKTFATAYQGCSSLKLEPMNDQSPSLRGVSIVGTHPMGGSMREITDLQTAYKTHYYISMQQPDTQCKDLSRSPLIYDFGGKPYATSSDQSKLDFFKDSGSGTSVLGVDCGGYIFSAMMAAGLRFKANVPVKAVHIYNISANMNPSSYSYNCFAYPPNEDAIHAGDILSTSGHIVMIDAVGDDPFGLDEITRVEDCRDGVIKSDNFNFVISQSSPSKGAIGLNRMLASTYAKESSTYRAGFMNQAIAACKARFGVNASVNRSSLWWLRHKKTAECRQGEIGLERQECISKCM